MKAKYMMATKAIHLLGDISREEADICIIREEDADNYIGEWVTGFGFVEVKFPKDSTRDLTAEEVAKYHGMVITLAGRPSAINLTGEDFRKPITITRDRDGRVFSGTLVAPIRVGSSLCMITDEGRVITTSTVEEVGGGCIKTKNSVYVY